MVHFVGGVEDSQTSIVARTKDPVKDSIQFHDFILNREVPKHARLRRVRLFYSPNQRPSVLLCGLSQLSPMLGPSANPLLNCR